MSVIVALSISPDSFELGRILDIQDDASVVLETMVPLGGRSIPFFRRFDGSGDSFETAISDHPAVNDIHIVSSEDGETLYALDWDVSQDSFLDGVRQTDAHVLEATGTVQDWSFELRFPSHHALSAFREYCVDVDLPIEVERIFNPTRPEAGPWFGLTGPQRAMLARAVEAGYYSIPRGTSTQALADEFDISDQAVTERLRRAIATLVTNTLDVAEPDE